MPELDVTDLAVSLDFYVSVCGFAVRHRRREEGFAYLEREGAELMLQDAAGRGRRFRTAPLQRPYGRGINLQIEVDAIDPLHRRAVARGAAIIVPLETRWYGADDDLLGNRQFVVEDPDGYLLRFFEDVPREASDDE